MKGQGPVPERFRVDDGDEDDGDCDDACDGGSDDDESDDDDGDDGTFLYPHAEKQECPVRKQCSKLDPADGLAHFLFIVFFWG